MNVNMHRPVVRDVSKHDSGVRVVKIMEEGAAQSGDEISLFFKDQAALARFVAGIAVMEFGEVAEYEKVS